MGKPAVVWILASLLARMALWIAVARSLQ